jgi:hypothetical protein
MPEVSQQIFLGNDQVFAFYDDKWSGINPYQASSFDADAQAFITATGISGSNATAINNLVLALKADNYWTGLKAIYPMIGGTSTTCKYNLKNPLDTDAAFRLTFAGTWVFNSSGAKPDGVAGTYAETYATPTLAGLSTTNGHISYYSFTNSAAANEVEIGNGGSSAAETNIAANFDGNYYTFYAAAGGSSANTNSSGFYINNRAANTEGWRNGTRLINSGNGTVSVPTRVVYLAAQNNGVDIRNSDRACGYASIGDTLSDPAAYTTIVNNFNTTLGRNTF